jgi:glycosyltransferase involved in cell wall biosynthesis
VSDALPVTLVAHEVGTEGGMERQLGGLVHALLQRGHEVTVIARRCALAPRPGLVWAPVPGPSRPFSVAYPWFAIAATLALRRHRRGVVHTAGAIVLARADVSTVHFCHHGFRASAGARVGRRRSPPYRLNAWVCDALSRGAERALYRPDRIARLVAVSQGLAQELRSHFHGAAGWVCVVPNVLDLERFAPDRAAHRAVREELGLDPQALIALFVGGDWARKGLAHAIEGVAARPSWQLVVVGEGDAISGARLAAARGAADRVHFVGPRHDPEQWYAAADAFVQPSSYETFSLAAHEAAAAGLPLLVTRVSGAEELVSEGTTGFFIERDAGSIAKSLSELEIDDGRRRAMGQAARSRVSRTSWTDIAERYAAIYAEITGPGSHARQRSHQAVAHIRSGTSA